MDARKIGGACKNRLSLCPRELSERERERDGKTKGMGGRNTDTHARSSIYRALWLGTCLGTKNQQDALMHRNKWTVDRHQQNIFSTLSRWPLSHAAVGVERFVSRSS